MALSSKEFGIAACVIAGALKSGCAAPQTPVAPVTQNCPEPKTIVVYVPEAGRPNSASQKTPPPDLDIPAIGERCMGGTRLIKGQIGENGPEVESCLLDNYRTIEDLRRKCANYAKVVGIHGKGHGSEHFCCVPGRNK